MKTIRVQCSRQRKDPPNTLRVVRPFRWGNPFIVPAGLKGPAKIEAQARAVDSFASALRAGELAYTVEDVRRELAGRNLACWCPPGTPCHADVLLAIANGEGGRP